MVKTVAGIGLLLVLTYSCSNEDKPSRNLLLAENSGINKSSELSVGVRGIGSELTGGGAQLSPSAGSNSGFIVPGGEQSLDDLKSAIIAKYNGNPLLKFQGGANFAPPARSEKIGAKKFRWNGTSYKAYRVPELVAPYNDRLASIEVVHFYGKVAVSRFGPEDRIPRTATLKCIGDASLDDSQWSVNSLTCDRVDRPYVPGAAELRTRLDVAIERRVHFRSLGREICKVLETKVPRFLQWARYPSSAIKFYTKLGCRINDFGQPTRIVHPPYHKYCFSRGLYRHGLWKLEKFQCVAKSQL